MSSTTVTFTPDQLKQLEALGNVALEQIAVANAEGSPSPVGVWAPMYNYILTVLNAGYTLITELMLCVLIGIPTQSIGAPTSAGGYELAMCGNGYGEYVNPEFCGTYKKNFEQLHDKGPRDCDLANDPAATGLGIPQWRKLDIDKYVYLYAQADIADHKPLQLEPPVLTDRDLEAAGSSAKSLKAELYVTSIDLYGTGHDIKVLAVRKGPCAVGLPPSHAVQGQSLYVLNDDLSSIDYAKQRDWEPWSLNSTVTLFDGQVYVEAADSYYRDRINVYRYISGVLRQQAMLVYAEDEKAIDPELSERGQYKLASCGDKSRKDGDPDLCEAYRQNFEPRHDPLSMACEREYDPSIVGFSSPKWTKLDLDKYFALYEKIRIYEVGKPADSPGIKAYLSHMRVQAAVQHAELLLTRVDLGGDGKLVNVVVLRNYLCGVNPRPDMKRSYVYFVNDDLTDLDYTHQKKWSGYNADSTIELFKGKPYIEHYHSDNWFAFLSASGELEVYRDLEGEPARVLMITYSKSADAAEVH